MKSTKDMPKGMRANPSQTSEGEARATTNEERVRHEQASAAEARKAQAEQAQGKTTELAREQDRNRETQPDILKDDEGKPVEAAAAVLHREQTVPEPAGRGGEMQIRRAAGQETSTGGIHLVNRENYVVRVKFEGREEGDRSIKGSVVELMANDTTAISLEEGDKVVLERI